jgi:hypothetical protein
MFSTMACKFSTIAKLIDGERLPATCALDNTRRADNSRSFQLAVSTWLKRPYQRQSARLATLTTAVIDAIMYLFKSYNLRLVLAIGNPIPSWAAPWRHGCAGFLPPMADFTSFNTLKK